MGLALIVSAYYGTEQTSKWFKDWRTVAGSHTTPPVTNGALSVLQVVNSPTSTRRSQGRSPNVVYARPHCEVSYLLAPMKGSACLLDRRKYTALMEVACATTACGKRLRAFLIEEQKIVAKVLKAQQA